VGRVNEVVRGDAEQLRGRERGKRKRLEKTSRGRQSKEKEQRQDKT